MPGPEKYKIYYHLLDAIRRFAAHLPIHESGVEEFQIIIILWWTSWKRAYITCQEASAKTKYDWEINKGHLEVFDKYGFRYIFDISVSIAFNIFLDFG
jgi:hypothetical protein